MTADGRATPRPSRAFLAALLSISALAVIGALRYRYGFGLTLDEPFMANTVRLPWRELWTWLPVDNLPFGYAALKAWTAIFGESELALRSLSGVAFGAAVFLAGLTAHRIGGTAAGIGASALMLVSDRLGLEYAATARSYALLACIASAAAWQTVDLMASERASRRRATALGLVHLAGLFTHPAYAIVPLGFAAASAFAERRLRAATVAVPLVAVATYAVVWAPILWATIALGTTQWMRSPSAHDVVAAVTLPWGARPAIVLTAALAGAVALGRRRAVTPFEASAARWVVAAAILTWVLPIGISCVKPVFEATKTPMLLLPTTCIAVAVVLVRGGGPWLMAICVLVCSVAGAYRIAERPRHDPAPSGETLTRLLARTQCGDEVIAPGVTATTAAYYFRRLHAPDCVRLVAFPRDAREVFGNWQGRLADPGARGRLEQEAQETARAAAAAHTIWLLGLERWETKEASAMIDGAVSQLAACDAPERATGAFIDSIRRCTPRSR